MSITLHDIVEAADYDTAVASGYLRVQRHPDLDLLIHNYTDKATWDNAWTPATLACRGLVTTVDGAVVARPFPKFFNLDQPQAPQVHPDDEVVVMDKADGSLGILYPLPDGTHAIATRGSFASDQAVWATAHYRDVYADAWTPNPDWTYMFEIVFPENRIVVDYGDLRDLVLLGAVDIATGASIPVNEAAAGWTGPVVEVFPYRTLREAIASPDRANAEGFVVWHPASGQRTKIKYAQYKLLHKIMTGVTPRHVWEVLMAGEDPAATFAAAPDEFHGWLRTVVADLRAQHEAIAAEAHALHAQVLERLPDGFTRREYAEAAVHASKTCAHLRPLLFLILDANSIDAPVWKLVRPAGDAPLRRVASDAD
jgi:RNA ligase